MICKQLRKTIFVHFDNNIVEVKDQLIFVELLHVVGNPLFGFTSDIIDHGFLKWLKCPLVPEQSLISHKNEHYFSMKMTAPYNYELETFIQQLRTCCQAKEFELAPFICDIISENGQNFVELQIPYDFIGPTQLSAIQEYIYSSIKNVKLSKYYKNCNTARSVITMASIDQPIDDMLNTTSNYDFFFLTKDDVWAVIAKFIDPSKQNSNLDIVDREVANTFENFPSVNIVYESYKGTRLSIQTTRDSIFELFQNSVNDSNYPKWPNQFLVSLKDFIETKSFREYKFSRKMVSLMSYLKYNVTFAKVPETDQVKMDLTPYYVDELEKMGVKWTRNSALNKSHYFDKENFFKALLALSDIHGDFPFDERYFQFRYYSHNLEWDKFKEQLHFVLTLKEKNLSRTNYTPLARKLLEYCCQMLNEKDLERGNNILQILYDVLSTLKPLCKMEIREINSILLEILSMSKCENENGEKPNDLVANMFVYSYRADLEESRFFVSELYGLPFGETFETDIFKNGLEMLVVEIAERMKSKGLSLAN